jgi:hypothetical protein
VDDTTAEIELTEAEEVHKILSNNKEAPGEYKTEEGSVKFKGPPFISDIG